MAIFSAAADGAEGKESQVEIRMQRTDMVSKEKDKLPTMATAKSRKALSNLGMSMRVTISTRSSNPPKRWARLGEAENDGEMSSSLVRWQV